MKIVKFNVIAIMASCLFFLSSCQSKEEQVISSLDSIEQTMTESGDYLEAQEWDALMEEYSALKEEAVDCEFTPEQMKELGRIDSKIVVAYTRRKANDIGKRINNFVNGASDYMEGFSEGLEESSNEYYDEYDEE